MPVVLLVMPVVVEQTATRLGTTRTPAEVAVVMVVQVAWVVMDGFHFGYTGGSGGTAFQT